MTAAQRSIPRASLSRTWLRTQSLTVTMGNEGPKGFPVAGSVLDGPVLPWQPPRLFTPTTKKRLVSMTLPGPTTFSHHPGLASSAEW